MRWAIRNRTDLANSLKFTVRTLADIENGVRKASPGTYAMLENKLGWAPGSIDTILAGGEPKELVVKLRRDSPEPRYHVLHHRRSVPGLHRGAAAGAATAHHRRRATDAARPGTTGTVASTGDWDGLDSRGDWPEEG